MPNYKWRKAKDEVACHYYILSYTSEREKDNQFSTGTTSQQRSKGITNRLQARVSLGKYITEAGKFATAGEEERATKKNNSHDVV